MPSLTRAEIRSSLRRAYRRVTLITICRFQVYFYAGHGHVFFGVFASNKSLTHMCLPQPFTKALDLAAVFMEELLR